MQANTEEYGNTECTNYEAQLEELQKNRQIKAAQLETFEQDLAKLETRGGENAGEIAGLKREIESSTKSIADTNKIIAAIQRKQKIKAALGSFDRIAAELVEVAQEVGLHASGIASAVSRGQRTAENMNYLVAELFPNGSSLQWAQQTMDSAIFTLFGDEGYESPLKALEEISHLGDFVKSRMASLKLALETELRIRR